MGKFRHPMAEFSVGADSVAAFILRAIEQGIGTREHRLMRVVGAEGGDAGREGNLTDRFSGFAYPQPLFAHRIARPVDQRLASVMVNFVIRIANSSPP